MEPGKFAHLIEHEELGQVLVKYDKDEDHRPEIRVYVWPEGLGVCSLAFTFEDTDNGWSEADRFWKVLYEGPVVAVAQEIVEQASGSTSD